MNFTTTRRWSDNNSHFGPFTWSRDNYRKLGIMLDSGADEYPGCHLRIHFGTKTLLIELPPIIRPWRKWIDLSKESWAKSPGYWDEHPKEYGFSLADGALHVHYGPQTHDSTTTKSKCYFIPWQEWQFHRLSLYDLDGKLFWTQLESDRRKDSSVIQDWFAAQQAAEAACPTATFSFVDFDGEQIEAHTHIEEREWKLGTGWFKWLRWFRPAKIVRSLDLKFSKEVGPEKGSWKGGTVGHSIKMLPGELHREAFLRYCAEHKLTLIRDPI